MMANLEQIRTWENLKRALLEMFVPVEHLHNLRDKMFALKQKGTILTYINDFQKVAIQIPNLSFEEAQHAYLQGLNPRIRDLVQTREGFTDIRSLQNTCLRLDTKYNGREPEEVLYLDGNRGGKQGATHKQGKRGACY
jgi:hypothetical protein